MKTYTRKDFENHENFCLYPFIQLYCDSTHDGKFNVQPCCITTDNNRPYASSIDSIFNHDYLKDVRQTFMSNKIPSDICNECISNEKLQNRSNSKRTEALLEDHVYHSVDFAVEEDGTMISDFQDLDIRPSNICNLKCIMCNPWYSSKWYEDFDIFTNTFLDTKDPNFVDRMKKSLTRANKQTDWDWLYSHSDKLKRVFIAGGEPFFMKESRNFLQHLVQTNVSSNITLEITTNATLIDNALINLLKMFKDNCITISLDGVDDINHIIRYPTDWNEYCANVDLLCNEFNHIVFSTVVTAMNLPDVINMLNFTSQYSNIHEKHHLARCVYPEILTINSLKPIVINRFIETLNTVTIDSSYYNWLQDLIKNYAYNEQNNSMMKQYLESLDKSRNTNSKSVLSWCWE